MTLRVSHTLNHPEVHNGADAVLPADLYIPGRPPHLFTILAGPLRLLRKLAERHENEAPQVEVADRR
jgi:Ni,Fe-hydrogenase III small subunit